MICYSYLHVAFIHLNTIDLNYQTKLALIDASVDRISSGLAWDDLQTELKQTDGLYQKDIDDVSRKVIKAVGEKHGPSIHDALLADPKTVVNNGLDPTVFDKIRTAQEQVIRNTFVNRIVRDLVEGKNSAQVLVDNQHPLLQEEDYRKAASRARNKLEVKAESESNRSPLNLVLGLLFLLGGIGLTAASDGQAIFYGAILVGLGMIVKFLIG